MTAPSQLNQDIPIVMTATIIPNVTGAASIDPTERLNEYAAAVKFYRRHAPVVFLENSGYDLASHPEFQETPGLTVMRFPRSNYPERGKGFQEFEMLDAWLTSEVEPPSCWMKVSGRYRLRNVGSLLAECRANTRASLIMDQCPRIRATRTYVFWVSTPFYRQKLAGIYRRCDDRTGAWIERVLFQELKRLKKGEIRTFATQPWLAAIAGSSGQAFPSGRVQWMIKQQLRNLNRLVDKTYLWYSR